MSKSADTVSFSRYEKIVVFLLALTQFTVVLDFMVMAPLGDILTRSMHLDPAKFGLIVSAYAFSAGISGLLTAGFADRFDRKKILLFFYIGFIIGTFLCGISNSFLTLFLARIFTGIFGGVMGSISMAILTDIFAIEKRGRALGIFQMGFGASQVMGIPIGLYIANLWGWEMPFLFIVGLAIIVAILLFVNLKPITAHLFVDKVVHNPFRHFWKVLSNNLYLLAFATTAIIALGGYMMMPYGTIFAVNNLKISQNELPFLFMASGVTSLIFMPMMGRLSDKMSKVKLFTISAIALIIVCVIYTSLGQTPFYIVLIFNVLMMSSIAGRAIPATTLVSGVPTLEDRGAFMSINASLNQFAGGIAAIVGGMIVTQASENSPLENYNIVGVIVSVMTVGAIFMMIRIDKVLKRRNL